MHPRLRDANIDETILDRRIPWTIGFAVFPSQLSLNLMKILQNHASALTDSCPPVHSGSTKRIVVLYKR
jgi:hypothetical protein